MHRIEALLFDFDGTIVDTESPILRAWQEIFEEHGHSLELEEWAACVGTVGGFDAVGRLEELLGRAVDDVDALHERRRARELEMVALQEARPGVVAYLERARELSLDVVIVSSSSDDWVSTNLKRLGRAEGWARVHCANGDQTRAKPLPCLYEEALGALGIDASAAVAFEDSPNGIRAARAAGIFCVAVPNAVTRDLDVTDGDLLLGSFEDASLDEVLRAAAQARAR